MIAGARRPRFDHPDLSSAFAKKYDSSSGEKSERRRAPEINESKSSRNDDAVMNKGG